MANRRGWNLVPVEPDIPAAGAFGGVQAAARMVHLPVFQPYPAPQACISATLTVSRDLSMEPNPYQSPANGDEIPSSFPAVPAELSAMKADFELTPDDLIAFITYHNMQSPTVRRQRIGCGVVFFLAMSILPLFVLVNTNEPLLETAIAIWPLLLGPLLLPFIFIPLYKWSLRRAAARMVNERGIAGYFGPCCLSIGPEGIVETKATGQTIRKWEYVNRLRLTPKYIFVYTSWIEAFILPKRAFEDDRHNRGFVDQIAIYAGVTPDSG